MSRSILFSASVISAVFGVLLGCAPRQPIYLTERGNFQKHYLTNATQIEYPDTNVPSIPDVENVIAPFTLQNANPREEWLISLEESIRAALDNAKVVRTLNGVNYSSGGVFGSPSVLLSSPNSIATSWDPAIVETDPRYGIAAALSAFDAQFQSQVGWTKANESVGSINDSGVWQSTISKTTVSGGTFYVTNDNRYSDGHSVYSAPYWTTYMEGGFTQPLLKGRGIQFNRIAGPNAIPGFNSGILIARVNNDISLANFEIAVRNLVADVEKAYWNLAFAYHSLDSVVYGRDAALRTWQQIDAQKTEGSAKGTGQAEAQARQQYLLFKAQTETAQTNLFQAESKLRYIMGIAATDGRLLKPATAPTAAPMRFDYMGVVAESLARSPELRIQKWDVRKKEMELIAQKNFILPQLDLKANYRFNGRGEQLINDSNNTTSAFQSLVNDDLSTWGTYLSLTVPLGFRQGHAAVRNAELACAKARAILQEQELELTHQLADVYRDVSQFYVNSQTNYDRILSARDEVEAVRISYEYGNTPLDQVLDAQRRLAEAETQYYRALVDYNISLSTLHLRKGSLLEYNNVALAEGPWPAKAVQHDAVMLARKRDAGHYMNYGYSLPQPISRGAYAQFQNNDAYLMPNYTDVQNLQSEPSVLESPTKALPKVETEEWETVQPFSDGAFQLPSAPIPMARR